MNRHKRRRNVVGEIPREGLLPGYSCRYIGKGRYDVATPSTTAIMDAAAIRRCFGTMGTKLIIHGNANPKGDGVVEQQKVRVSAGG